MTLQSCNCELKRPDGVQPPPDCTPCWQSTFEFVDKESRAIYRKPDEAEAVTSRVMLQLAKKWPETDERKLDTAVRTLVHDRGIDEHRAGGRRRREHLADDSAPEHGIPVSTMSATPPINPEDFDAPTTVEAVLERFLDEVVLIENPSVKEALKLRVLYKKSFADIAKAVPSTPDGKFITGQRWGQKLQPIIQDLIAYLRQGIEAND